MLKPDYPNYGQISNVTFINEAKRRGLAVQKRANNKNKR
jgi:hypothetical protein